MKIAENKSFDRTKKRIWEIDFLRGLAIFLMIFDHLAYDFATFNSFFINSYQISNPVINSLITFSLQFETSALRNILHLIFAGLFFVLCGISSTFSRNNWKRAFEILLFCFLLDFATFLIYYLSDKNIDVRMIFNVLFALSIGILLVQLLSYFSFHRKAYLFLGILILYFGIAQNSFSPTWVNEEFTLSMIPDIFLGKIGYGSDCFSLIYVGYVFLGAYIGETFYNKKVSLLPSLDGKWNRFFLWIGKHTLIIYLFHQVIFAIVIVILGICLGYRLF